MERLTSTEEQFTQLDYLDYFTTPFDTQWEHIELANLPQGKYNHVIVVGRFQPLHYGHIYLIKQAAQLGHIVTIGVGSANIHNFDNPFTVGERLYMLKKAIQKEHLTSQIKNIVALNDYSDDTVWINNTLEAIGTVDAVVGNNDWVNACFDSVGIPSEQVPLLQRGLYEGKRIRAFLRSVDKLPS